MPCSGRRPFPAHRDKSVPLNGLHFLNVVSSRWEAYTPTQRTYIWHSKSPDDGRPCSPPILLKLPLAIVQGADLPSLQPTRDAMKVEGVIADAPSHGALLAGVGTLVRLALNAQIHDVVPADGAIVHDNVPCPEGHCAPLLDLEALLTGT